jgi:transcriptional regulator NrdR family protein
MKALACPNCGEQALDVIDTNQAQNVLVRRRRACRKCGHRFSTVEIPAEEYDQLVKVRDQAGAARYRQALQAILKIVVEALKGA